jgi:hypothetical protein
VDETSKEHRVDWSEYDAAWQYLSDGDVLQDSGNFADARKAYRLSVGCNPDFKNLKTLCASGDTERIYIAGCSRSGTTLLACMMVCFDDVHIDFKERDFLDFVRINSRKKCHVMKRMFRSWATLDMLPDEIKLIYMVRHPYDVLTSFHPVHPGKKHYTSMGRWLVEFDALESIMTRRTLDQNLIIMKFEDLVTRPAQVQGRLENACSLSALESFEHFEKAVEQHSLPEQYRLALRGLRRPDSSTVERWKRGDQDADIQALVDQQPARLSRFLEIFGYERGNFRY